MTPLATLLRRAAADELTDLEYTDFVTAKLFCDPSQILAAIREAFGREAELEAALRDSHENWLSFKAHDPKACQICALLGDRP